MYRYHILGSSSDRNTGYTDHQTDDNLPITKFVLGPYSIVTVFIG